MREYPAIRDRDRCPAHPGELLREVIPATGKRKSEIAGLLRMSRQHLYDILNERNPASPAVARPARKLFGTGVWLRTQAAYVAWHAEREIDVSDIPRLETAA